MKSRFMRKALCILLICVLTVAAIVPAFAGTPAEDAHLHFNADGKFRILNFSDIQDDATLDDRVKVFIRRAVYQAQPDLIVLTGDNIYGNFVAAGNTYTAIAQFMDIFQSLGVPVAIVFGNHDDSNGVSKEDQMAFYNSYSVSISYDEGSSMDGCGTYNVPIYGSTETDRVKFNLWMFDTGSDTTISGYDHMRDNQLNWYVSKSNQLKAENGGIRVPSIAFQHIIVKEIYDALKKVSLLTSGAVIYNLKAYVLPDNAVPGSELNEHPCPSKSGDEFAVVRDQGDVLAIVSGHDHKNSFIVPYQGIDLINTPGVGFYSYGDENLRGARIIDLDEQTGTYSTEMLILRDLAQPQYYVQTGVSRYVKDIAICKAQSAQYESVDAAKAAAYARLYNAVDAANGNGIALREDLNGGSTDDSSSDNHHVILMGYTFTDNPNEAMRGLGVCYTGSKTGSGAQYDGTEANGIVWRLCNTNSFFVSGTDGAVNLNSGTSGNANYFVADYTSSNKPLTEIRIVNTGSDDAIDMDDYAGYTLANAVVGSNTGTSYADLNKSAKGDYVYALYRTSADGVTRIELDSQLLREACFRANKLLKNPETVYSETSMSALLASLAQAQNILRDLDDDMQTRTYDQITLDRTAQQVLTSLQNLETAWFTVTFDANGGTCNEQSRVYVYGTTGGELPQATRSRYISDGWFTAAEGGERIPEDLVYTDLFDQTWYAHWSPDLSWLAGDADRDNGVDLRDVAAIQRFLAGGWNTQIDPDHADVNADGKVDLRDVMLLRRFLSGGWNVVLV